MFLYLLRHADAETIAPTDDERFLSEKGIAQAKRVARFCAEHEFAPERILTSPLRRTRETAEIVAAELGMRAENAAWLASGMLPQSAQKKLAALGENESVMLVGHEPDFSEFAAHLLGLPDGACLRVRKAAIVGLQYAPLTGGVAQLDFLVPARLM